jgi:L-sorbose 1-phosphate reductase
MNSDYKETGTIPAINLKWLLYGSGFENLGKNNLPEPFDIPHIKEDELLLRVDVISLCFSDVKVVAQGNSHLRVLNRDLVNNPLVLGHEVCVTVLEVGEDNKENFKTGERYVVQPDMYYRGKAVTMGYVSEGALQQYIVAGKEILDGDGGCNLLPLNDTTGYSEAALCEPWSCVDAAYNIGYRRTLQKDGTVWIAGNFDADFDHYEISSLFADERNPAKIIVSGLKGRIYDQIKGIAEIFKIELVDIDKDKSPLAVSKQHNDGIGFNDIIIIGTPTPEFIEDAAETMARDGVLAIISDKPVGRKVNIDVGRVHYDGLLFTGTPTKDLSLAYTDTAGLQLKSSGSAWFIGAGGPMGQMHVQRAVETKDGPHSILATDIDDVRINEVNERYKEKREKFFFRACNPSTLSAEEFDNLLAQTCGKNKFDNIIILAPAPQLIEQASDWLGENGVLNIFAGIRKGTKVKMDINGCYLRGQKWVGSSGTSLQFMADVLKKIEGGELRTNRSVAAIGGLNAAHEGLMAVNAGAYPGKVIIYPQIIDMPLIPVKMITEKLPDISAKLDNGKYWTRDAEQVIMKTLPIYKHEQK